MAPTVLVVARERNIGRLIAVNLARLGAEVLTETDREAALAILRERLVRLVVVDTLAPEAWEMVVALHRGPTLQRLPIIALVPRVKAAVSLQDWHVDAYVVEPYDPEVLFDYTQRLLAMDPDAIAKSRV